MRHLIIDAGNTRVKVFVFEEDSLLFDIVCAGDFLLQNLEKIFSKFVVSKIILSSVGGINEEVVTFLSEKAPVLLLTSETKVPFVNAYGTPKTLGVDRIALMAAASVQYSKQNVLVIDAGTCVTYDLLTKDKVYLGGAISLGLQMRYKSLNAFTEKLPKLEFLAPENLIGTNTETSIHSGVVNGLVAEINGVVEQYKQQFSDLTVVLTGGDTIYLSKRLKNGIFAHPNFLIEGLHAILKHNTYE